MAQGGLVRFIKDLGLDGDDIITLRPAEPPAGASASAPACVEVQVAERGTLPPPAGTTIDKRLGRWEVVDEGRACFQVVLRAQSSLKNSLSVPGELRGGRARPRAGAGLATEIAAGKEVTLKSPCFNTICFFYP